MNFTVEMRIAAQPDRRFMWHGPGPLDALDEYRLIVSKQKFEGRIS